MFRDSSVPLGAHQAREHDLKHEEQMGQKRPRPRTHLEFRA